MQPLPRSLASTDHPPSPDFERQRRVMVLEQLYQSGIRDQRVLAAMATVPRHAFVPGSVAHMAYSAHALPIGFGQTISQPYTIARMLDGLGLQGGERVLEIGTGSGYQTAVLARLARAVHSIEIVPGLCSSATSRLARLGVDNVQVHLGDGSLGWSPAAPYQAIVVSAATPLLPCSLIRQLVDGGQLIVPVGTPSQQVLRRVVRRGTTIYDEDLELCSVAPLIGEEGFRGDFTFHAEVPPANPNWRQAGFPAESGMTRFAR